MDRAGLAARALRGELSALEVLRDETDADDSLEAILLYEDADIRSRRFKGAMPERVAAVSTGFPAGLVPHDVKLREIEESVSDGAAEIDIVITREHVLTGNWKALYDEMRDFRDHATHSRSILQLTRAVTLVQAKALQVFLLTIRAADVAADLRHADAPAARPDKASADPENSALERQLSGSGRTAAQEMGKAIADAL